MARELKGYKWSHKFDSAFGPSLLCVVGGWGGGEAPSMQSSSLNNKKT